MTGHYCLVLIGARGLRRAEVQFGKEVSEELSGAFAKRLRASLPISAVIGRWGPEEFRGHVCSPRSPKPWPRPSGSQNISSGACACLKAAKPSVPPVQLTVGVVETAVHEQPERIIERIGLFLVGQS